MRADEIKKRLGKYVNPDVIDRLLTQPITAQQIVHTEALLLVVDLRLLPIEGFPDRVEKLFRTVRDERGRVETSVSTMSLIVFPIPDAAAGPRPDEGAIVGKILAALSLDVRVVSLQTSVYRGCFGRDEHSFYGTVSPDILSAIALLSTVEFGKSRRWPDTVW